MFGAYLHILHTRDVRQRLAAVLLSSMPLGMLSLAIVLFVQERIGELGVAGLLSGLFGLGNALGLSLQGTLIDRFGARPVVLAAGSTCCLALLGFSASGILHSSLWLMAAVVLVAGISVPAITAAVRSWLPEVFAAPAMRGSSYALLSVMFRGGVTMGPLLVSGAMFLHGPGLALALAAMLVLVAAMVFSLSGAQERGRRPLPMRRRPPSCVVSSPGLRTLLVSAGSLGLATGSTTVAVAGSMTLAGAAELAGIAFAALALGEVLAALGFGARAWPGQQRAQLVVVQPVVALVAALVFLVADKPWLLVSIMFAAGVLRSPVSILQSALLDDVVPGDHLARGYSLLVAVTVVSNSAGHALAGPLVDRLGAHTVLLVPVMALVLASLWTAARYSTLRA